MNINNIENVFLRILRDRSAKSEIGGLTKNFAVRDWESLLNLAVKSGLCPIFYTKLSSLNLENLPSGIKSRLTNIFFLNLQTNIELEQELINVMICMEKNRIPAIPLKGPALARLLYKDPALRRASCDLDILVHHDKVKDAEEKLAESGYVINSDKIKTDFFHTFNKQIDLSKKIKNGGVILDLHWDLHNRMTETHLQEFWKNAREISMNGARFLMPSGEDLLLYLALCSISSFDFVEMKNIYDIHMLLTAPDITIDWEELIEKAKRFGLDKALFIALDLSEKLFAAKIPDGPIDRLRLKFPAYHILKIWITPGNILRHKRKIASGYSWHYFASSYIYSRNTFDCLKIICRKLFPPMGRVMGMAGRNVSEKSYSLYIKRLLKPVTRIFR